MGLRNLAGHIGDIAHIVRAIGADGVPTQTIARSHASSRWSPMVVSAAISPLASPSLQHRINARLDDGRIPVEDGFYLFLGDIDACDRMAFAGNAAGGGKAQHSQGRKSLYSYFTASLYASPARVMPLQGSHHDGAG